MAGGFKGGSEKLFARKAILQKRVNVEAMMNVLSTVHGLPLYLMTEKIRTIIGESIGDVEEVDADEGRMA
ncbi:hypothetical protein CRYUN_Cryun41cG0048500 [Craigia yunnanensis]